MAPAFQNTPILGSDSSTIARRDALFRETPVETLERWALGTVWALKPERIAGVPSLCRVVVSDLLQPRPELPNPDRALEAPVGLCGIARDLSVPTVLQAYRRSLFPFAHLGPLKWFSPPERCVLFFDEFRMSKSARRLMRQGRYTVTFDRDFEGVVKACAGRRDGKWHVTWITPRIMHTFATLYDAGHVHSFEVWNEAGELVGGGYGLALGGIFFTESQFSRESNTSKIGFAMLNWHLQKWGYALNDGKYTTPTILDMGFRVISRAAFRAELDRHADAPGKPGRWEVETDLATVSEWNRAVPSPKKGGKPAAESRPKASRESASTLEAALPT